MKSLLISIYDKKAKFFDKPVITPNEATAIRMLETTLSDPQAAGMQMSKTPEDFALYRLGSYDDNTGFINPEESPTHITDLIHLTPKEADLHNIKEAIQ